jgi:hypothetical protein
MRHGTKNIKQMEEALAEVWPTLRGERLTKLKLCQKGWICVLKIREDRSSIELASIQSL